MLQPRTNPVCADKASSSRAHVDDISSGIIDHTHFEGPASAPLKLVRIVSTCLNCLGGCYTQEFTYKAVCAHTIAERKPKRDEHHPSAKVHPAKKRACNKDNCNGSEDELEIGHGRFWIVLRNWDAGKVGLTDHLADC